jgi:hypothetical protein
VVALEYEAYEPMALKLMEKIADEAPANWSVFECESIPASKPRGNFFQSCMKGFSIGICC